MTDAIELHYGNRRIQHFSELESMQPCLLEIMFMMRMMAMETTYAYICTN